jgi:hypothetical protein
MTEQHTPPALHRLISALLLSPSLLDRLGYLIDAGVAAESNRNGAHPRTVSRSLT